MAHGARACLDQRSHHEAGQFVATAQRWSDQDGADSGKSEVCVAAARVPSSQVVQNVVSWGCYAGERVLVCVKFCGGAYVCARVRVFVCVQNIRILRVCCAEKLFQKVPISLRRLSGQHARVSSSIRWGR